MAKESAIVPMAGPERINHHSTLCHLIPYDRCKVVTLTKKQQAMVSEIPGCEDGGNERVRQVSAKAGTVSSI
ncbi:rCG47146 [Rattus norvegicus]|uniref:RCG47146 n=1 Tax=Rattus norvegicus TaxID=10116 RepID=A6HX92_RAT|nr:rCG47146 [Rattus norvegicus]